MARRDPPTIRLRLIQLVIASAVPGWLGSAFLLYRVHIDERAIIERDAGATVRALAVAIDRDIASLRAAALTLAASPSLLGGGSPAFDELAGVVQRSGLGSNLVLSDASGQELVNTLRPYGESLPRHGNPELVRKVFETGKPMLSDLYVGGVRRRPIASFDVPVLKGGRVVYDLSVGIMPERLSAILREQQLPPGWIVGVFDSTGTIAARIPAADRFVGQKGSPELVARMARARQGMLPVITREGIPVTSIFQRLQNSDWAIAVGVPTAELTARLRRSLAQSIVGTLALVALGIAAARIMGGRLARPIRALMAPALACGRGERVEVPPLGLKEADEVGRALVEGSRLLEQRTAERDRVERERQGILLAKQHAEEAARIRSAYFANLSHELRTPVTAILGFTELIAKGARTLPDGARYLDYCKRIDEGGQHVLTMVDEILDYAKYEANELVLHREPVDVAAEIGAVTGLVAGAAERAGIRLAQEVPGGIAPVPADPVRLRQILLNLLSNAVKFTPPGGTVTVSAACDGDGRLVIRVADTGIGISAEDLPRVIRPFGQAMNARTGKGGGTGLGLPLAKGLVELHGGSLDIASEPGLGTTVTIRLPMA